MTMPETNSPRSTDEAATHTTVRDRLAAASLWLPVLVLSVTATLWLGRLPAELPLGWLGAEGGTFARPEVLSGVLGMFALLAAVTGLISLADAAADIRPWLVLVAGVVGGLATATWLAAAGLGITGVPTSALAVLGLVLLVLLGAAYGLVPFLLSSRARRVRPQDGAAGVPLSPGESAAWFTTLRVPMFVVLAGIAVLLAVAVSVILVPVQAVGATAAVVTLLLVAALCLVFSRIRVSVDRRGLRVVSSLFRFPIAHVALDRIVSARPTELRPAEWGGWGYRIMPGRTAIVVSGHRGILVERDNGTHFAVTVPEPELPAALLSTLATR
jgi:hypothetical protein